MNPFEGIIELVTGIQAQQKAEQQIFQANTKEALRDKKALTEQQMAAEGRASVLKAQDQLQVSEGVAEITANLSADPTDPTSLMARNNVAITQLNEQLLNQYNAIDNVQRDDSFVGSLQKMLILPDLLQGAIQIDTQKQQFLNANTALQQQMVNQANQIATTVKLADTELVKAEQQEAAAKSMLAITDDKLKTAADYFRIQHMTSQDAMQGALAVADARMKSMMMPLQTAIMSNQVAQFKQQQEADALITKALGHPRGSSARILVLLKNDPQAYNAVATLALTGKVHTPFDAALVEPYMNKVGLTNADGTPKPQLAVVHEMSRPVLAGRVNGLMQDFIAAQKQSGMTDAEVNKLLSNRGTLRSALDKYQQTLPKNTMHPSDAATWNPAQLFKEVPQLEVQVPLVKEVVNNTGDKVTDMQPDALLNIVVKGNMNVPASKIAEQLAIYYQNALAYDRQRPIYDIAGIAPPNTVNQRVSRMGVVARFATERQKGGTKGPAGIYPLLPQMTGTRSTFVDFTNSAELEDYINEIKLRAALNIPQ